MGIQTWIKDIKRKRAQEKAFEKGKELSEGGKTLVPTTSGYIEVSKDSPLAPSSTTSGGGSTAESMFGTSIKKLSWTEQQELARAREREASERARQIAIQQQQERERQAELQRQQEERRRQEATARKGFTGKVSEIEKGVPVSTKYFYGGTQVGGTFVPQKETKGFQKTTPSAPSQLLAKFDFPRGETAEVYEEGVATSSLLPSTDGLFSAQRKHFQMEREAREEAVESSRERFDRLRRFDFSKEDFISKHDIEQFAPGTKSWQTISVPGTIAKSFGTGTDVILAQTRLDKRMRDTILETPVPVKIEQIGGELVLFGAFAPAMTSTAQFERELAKKIDVAFLGTSQKQTRGIIKTDIGFVTTQAGKKTSEGIARGFSKSVLKREADILSDTFAFGTSIEKGVRFPSAKPVTKYKDLFVGAERSLTRFKDDKFAQLSYGILRKIKAKSNIAKLKMKEQDINRFISGGIGKTKGEYTGYLGRVLSERGTSDMVGVVKQIPSKAEDFSISISRGKSIVGGKTPSLSILDKKAVSSVQNIVVASAQKPFVQPVYSPSFSSSFLKPLTTKTKTRTISSVRDMSRQLDRQVSVQSGGLLLKESQFLKPRQELSGRQIDRQIQKLVQGTKQIQKQKQKTFLKLQQKFKHPGRTGIPSLKIRFRIPKEPPLIPFFLPVKPRKKKKKKDTSYKDFDLFVQGFTARALFPGRVTKITRTEKGIASALRKQSSPLSLRFAPVYVSGKKKSKRNKSIELKPLKIPNLNFKKKKRKKK